MRKHFGISPANPQAAYLAHEREIDAAIRDVVDSGAYILGEEVRDFEAQFATYLGVGDAVGVASGTDALELSLLALEIGQGDAVLTVAHTAVATVAAIERTGARPVLVDIDPQTYTIDPQALEATLRDPVRWHGCRPRAIVPVHLYGHPADMSAILEVAERHGLFVVEDCAQAHGATLDGRRVGSFGTLAAFSFYPTKNLGALGDAGMAVTDDPQLAELLRSLRQYGWNENRVSLRAGTNSRLDELQAAVLRVRLPYLDDENSRRRQIAEMYGSRLAGTRLGLPQVADRASHVFHQYVVRCHDRDSLRRHLERDRIGTAVHYPQPVHLQPAYAGRLGGPGDLPETEAAAGEILSLPIYPQLTDHNIERVIDRILAWTAHAGSPQGGDPS